MKKLLLFGLILLLAGCVWPHDPENTTETVQNDHVMFVGVSENPPWVTRMNETPGGVEVTLVQAFAEEMDAEIEWQWGSMSEHLEALAHYELDLAIGGLTAAAPGVREVGQTQPFYESRIVVGIPENYHEPVALDDAPVGVIRGTAVAAYVQEAGARPIFLADAAHIDRPTAVPHWQLDDLDLENSGQTLHTLQHVMAVPPGENRWLTELETFLYHHPDIQP